jgi:hypothetical protein
LKARKEMSKSNNTETNEYGSQYGRNINNTNTQAPREGQDTTNEAIEAENMPNTETYQTGKIWRPTSTNRPRQQMHILL